MRILTLVKALLGLYISPKEVLEIYGIDGRVDPGRAYPLFYPSLSGDYPKVRVDLPLDWSATILADMGGLTVLLETDPVEGECEECGASVSLDLSRLPMIRIPNGSSIELSEYEPALGPRGSIRIRARWLDAIIRWIAFRRMPKRW